MTAIVIAKLQEKTTDENKTIFLEMNTVDNRYFS